MIDFLKGTVGKDYFSDRLYGCQECIAEYLASKEPKNITLILLILKILSRKVQIIIPKVSNINIYA